MKVFFALPAFNEERDLAKLLASFEEEMRAAGFDFQVVIVDDGSTDGTLRVMREWAERIPLEIVQHIKNRGLGETIRDALNVAAKMAHPDDVIVTMDADNTHSPALIPSMVDAIEHGNDVVIASRYRHGSKVVGLSYSRHLMSYGARFIFQLAFPLKGVRDYTCGFRAYRASLLKNAFARYGNTFVQERGFAAMAEILLKLRALRPKFSEVPMILRYDLKTGDSKMRVGATVMKTLRMVHRLRTQLPA